MRPPAGLAGITDRVVERLPDVVTDRLSDPLGRARPERPPAPRVLLVTGASSGIGRAVAHEAASLGDHLVLAARDDESLAEVAQEFARHEVSIATVRQDGHGDAATLVIVTHSAPDAALSATVEALAAKVAGDGRTILFGLSGHGHFDLAAYDAYLGGTLEDPEFSEDDLRAALDALPAGVPTLS